MSPGNTTFVQEEKFSGLLGGLTGGNWVANWMGLRAKTIRGFERFNRDFGRWVEGG